MLRDLHMLILFIRRFCFVDMKTCTISATHNSFPRVLHVSVKFTGTIHKHHLLSIRLISNDSLSIRKAVNHLDILKDNGHDVDPLWIMREGEREKKRFWISLFCEYLNATFDFEYSVGRDQVVMPALLQARNTIAVLCRIEYSKYKDASFLKWDGYERTMCK